MAKYLSGEFKYTDDEVRESEELRQRALKLINSYEYRGSGSFLDSVKESWIRGRNLSVPQLRGILNCIGPKKEQPAPIEILPDPIETMFKPPVATTARLNYRFATAHGSKVLHLPWHSWVVWDKPPYLKIHYRCGNVTVYPLLYDSVFHEWRIGKKTGRYTVCQKCAKLSKKDSEASHA